MERTGEGYELKIMKWALHFCIILQLSGGVGLKSSRTTDVQHHHDLTASLLISISPLSDSVSKCIPVQYLLFSVLWQKNETSARVRENVHSWGYFTLLRLLASLSRLSLPSSDKNKKKKVTDGSILLKLTENKVEQNSGMKRARETEVLVI